MLKAPEFLLIITATITFGGCASSPSEGPRTTDRSKAQNESVNSPSKMDPVIGAIQSGNMDALTSILEDGGDPNVTDAAEGHSESMTALSVSVVWGKPEMAKTLIKAGASVNRTVGGIGITPLHLAAGISSPQIESGHYTVEGQLDLIEFLLENGANIDARDSTGSTPLFWASEFGSENAAAMLIEKGALIGITDNRGDTAITAAEKAGQTEIASMLHNWASETSSHSEVEVDADTLIKAIRAGELSTVKEILKLAPHFANAQTREGYTPIILAIMSQQIDVALYLAKTYPFALSTSADNGWTPLHFVFNGDPEHSLMPTQRKDLAEALINNGVPLEEPSDDGMTPLFLATNNAMSEGVATLIEAGANVDFRTPERGITPLMISAIRDTKSMQLLLDAAADPALEDNKGRTALHYVLRDNQDESQTERANRARALITSGASVNATDKHQETPLMLAAESGSADVAKVLMENGAAPDLQNSRGETAEFIALIEDHYEVIQVIRQHSGQ